MMGKSIWQEQLNVSNVHKIVTAVALMVSGASATAQRTIVVDPENNPAVRRGAVAQAPPGAPIGADPNIVPIAVLQGDLRVKAGDQVQFERDSFALDDAAMQKLAQQANWLRMNPMVRASIEGHADIRQSRDHALALGERRAAAVHGFLLAQGVPPTQLTMVSWGKERPAIEGAHDATWLQNSRVVTVLKRPEPGTFLPPPQPPLLPPPLPPID